MSSADKFAAIFNGLQLAYGTFKIDKKQLNGKGTGRAAIVREPRTNYGKGTCPAKVGPSVSYLSMKTTDVFGGVLTLISTP